MPDGSFKSVRDICREILNEGLLKPKKKRGRKPIIREFSREASIIYHALSVGLSVDQTTVQLNEFRQSLDPPLPKAWSEI